MHTQDNHFYQNIMSRCKISTNNASTKLSTRRFSKYIGNIVKLESNYTSNGSVRLTTTGRADSERRELWMVVIGEVNMKPPRVLVICREIKSYWRHAHNGCWEQCHLVMLFAILQVWTRLHRTAFNRKLTTTKHYETNNYTVCDKDKVCASLFSICNKTVFYCLYSYTNFQWISLSYHLNKKHNKMKRLFPVNILKPGGLSYWHDMDV